MRFSETKLDVLKTGDGQELDIHIWEPEAPKAVLMAIHGGLAHAGDYVTPALYFKERDIATVSYDLRGHKQEKTFISGFDQYLEDTADFLEWTKKAYKDIPIFVVGHSMGGLIATHFGIRYADNDSRIKGYLLSSPYYGNAIKVPPIMIPLIKLFGFVIPKAVIPGPDLTELLTHDEVITKRHRQDEEDGIRGTKPTMRFGSELLKAQKWVKENFSQWHHPTFAVIAGADQVAASAEAEELFKSMDSSLLTYVLHKDNFHENFNEVNRNETFDQMYAWIWSIIGE
ncbi:MAG: alpha/beta hydrolase [Desulfobacteraceae bacterium]|nr:alpha/beta fold hydrolase [Desulfobacteraceae bacterium]MBC2757594.1 alpha/beta hydrolase [Desulfobacteraceae bacterium]